MRLEAEMPEAALGLGQRRIERAVIEEQDGLVRIAHVVFLQSVADRVSDVRHACNDVTDVLVDRLLEDDQGFLRIALVVERNDLQLAAVQRPTARIDEVRGSLDVLECFLALQRERAAQGSKKGDFDRICGERAGERRREKCRDCSAYEIG